MSYKVYNYDNELLETISDEKGELLLSEMGIEESDEFEYYKSNEEGLSDLQADLKNEFANEKDIVKILVYSEDE